jgi:hypothetical protein
MSTSAELGSSEVLEAVARAILRAASPAVRMARPMVAEYKNAT